MRGLHLSEQRSEVGSMDKEWEGIEVEVIKQCKKKERKRESEKEREREREMAHITYYHIILLYNHSSILSTSY